MPRLASMRCYYKVQDAQTFSFFWNDNFPVQIITRECRKGRSSTMFRRCDMFTTVWPLPPNRRRTCWLSFPLFGTLVCTPASLPSGAPPTSALSGGRVPAEAGNLTLSQVTWPHVVSHVEQHTGWGQRGGARGSHVRFRQNIYIFLSLEGLAADVPAYKARPPHAVIVRGRNLVYLKGAREYPYRGTAPCRSPHMVHRLPYPPLGPCSERSSSQ